MPQRRCPTCKNSFDTGESSSLPFCSPRCRQIDLGRWLNEEMAVPLELPTGDETDDDAKRPDDDLND